MFYQQIKNGFDQLNKWDKPYAQSIVLNVMLSLMSIGALIAFKPTNNSGFLISNIFGVTFVLSIIFLSINRRYKSGYLHCILGALSGCLAMLNLLIASLELIGWDNISIFVFGAILFLSTIVLSHLYNKEFDDGFLAQKTIFSSSASKRAWDGNLDTISIDSNPEHKTLSNFVQRFLVPFAPVLGMALSRNLEGQQELLVIGFLMLCMVLSLYVNNLKKLVLGLKFLYWKRTRGIEIEIIEAKK